jgi:hypothetical protein
MMSFCKKLFFIFIKSFFNTCNKMTHNAGIYVTINEGYGPDPFIITAQSTPKMPIRENWMNGPTRSNFTGCGSAGWNADKAPCASCGNGQQGSRICNACRTGASISADCGGNTCGWQTPLPPAQEHAKHAKHTKHANIFYF